MCRRANVHGNELIVVQFIDRELGVLEGSMAHIARVSVSMQGSDGQQILDGVCLPSDSRSG